YDDLDTVQRRVFLVEQQHTVGFLFDGSRLPQVGKRWRTSRCLALPIQLGSKDHSYTRIPGYIFETPHHLIDLQDPVLSTGHPAAPKIIHKHGLGLPFTDAEGD